MTQDVQQRIEQLRGELKNLHQEKEAWFSKKKDISTKITGLIDEIKQMREKRDDRTKFVHEAKLQRKDLNREIRKKIEDIKVMQDKKKKTSTPAAPSPTKLMADIKRMQYKIETEGVDFDTEQKLMKRIKEKQQLYENTKDFKDMFKDLKDLSKDIDVLKKKSDEIHEEIQGKATESQQFHEDMISTSKQVDELKEKEKEAYDNFVETKTKYADLNKMLKTALQESGVINTVTKQKNTQDYDKKRKQLLKEQEDAVRKKIASGETLTTEDLFIFQNMGDDDEEDIEGLTNTEEVESSEEQPKETSETQQVEESSEPKQES